MTSDQIVKIISGVAGAIVIGLQGINLSELGHVGEDGNKRMEVLQQLLALSKSMDQSLKNEIQILENGAKALERDEASIKTQGEILTTLKAAIEERRELLKQQGQENH